jgi:two-component system LytT family sensor kinase
VYGGEHGLVVETNVGAGTLVRMRVPKSQPGRVAASTGPARVVADRAREADGRVES